MWDNVLYISANNLKESIKINFFGKQYFIADDGQPFTDEG